MYDERHLAATRKYEKAHTQRWSESVAAADAFVFVTPQYNAGPPPSFVNALDYLYHEWSYKPCGFVSYGGAAGGMRAAQIEKLLVTTFKMAPLVEGVAATRVAQMFDADGTFRPDETMGPAATRLLDELHKWARALKPMREPGF